MIIRMKLREEPTALGQQRLFISLSVIKVVTTRPFEKFGRLIIKSL